MINGYCKSQAVSGSDLSLITVLAPCSAVSGQAKAAALPTNVSEVLPCEIFVQAATEKP